MFYVRYIIYKKKKGESVTMLVYHGSSVEVIHPDITRSRLDIDFGSGFYTTQDIHMAKKWACNRNESILNIYELELEDFEVKKLGVDEEWLYYVMENRTGRTGLFEMPFDDSKYDIIIGPTADDKLFNVIDLFSDGFISSENAIKVINCMNYSNQLVIKNQAAANRIRFIESKRLHGLEKDNLRVQFKNDNIEASKKARELIRKMNGGIKR